MKECESEEVSKEQGGTAAMYLTCNKTAFSVMRCAPKRLHIVVRRDARQTWRPGVDRELVNSGTCNMWLSKRAGRSQAVYR